MKQPPGFENKTLLFMFANLIRLFINCSKAPRAWYSRLTAKLQRLGFVPSKFDMSLFIYKKLHTAIFVLIYVDDIIVTSSHDDAITTLLKDLGSEFDLKDVGDIHFFVGTEVNKTSSGIICHRKSMTLVC